MIDIKRTGPPSARDVNGRIVTWVMPINAMPDKDWRQFFTQTKDTTLVCTPKHVHMYQNMMVFESAEEDVAHLDHLHRQVDGRSPTSATPTGRSRAAADGRRRRVAPTVSASSAS